MSAAVTPDEAASDRSFNLLSAALNYARRSLAVFPLHYPVAMNGRKCFCDQTIQRPRCSCGSPDCGNNAAKHPYARLVPNGNKNATTDLLTIERWWTAAPFNIGIRTGAPSGIIVVDVDPRHRGDTTLTDLERQHGPLPPTWRFLTGGGGEHVLFKHPGGEVRNDVGTKLGAGLDCRGDGGYIVAPPSLHISGRRYAVSVDHDPNDVPLAEAPRWLVEALRGAPRAKSAAGAMPQNWRRLVREGVGEGRRNDAVARLAGHLLRKDVDPYVVLDLARCWNANRCRPPLPDGEVVGAVNSICEREMARRAAADAR
jgi:hypothetical protein